MEREKHATMRLRREYDMREGDFRVASFASTHENGPAAFEPRIERINHQ
jgi:hypothetical protein